MLSIRNYIIYSIFGFAAFSIAMPSIGYTESAAKSTAEAYNRYYQELGRLGKNPKSEEVLALQKRIFEKPKRLSRIETRKKMDEASKSAEKAGKKLKEAFHSGSKKQNPEAIKQLESDPTTMEALKKRVQDEIAKLPKDNLKQKNTASNSKRLPASSKNIESADSKSAGKIKIRLGAKRQAEKRGENNTGNFEGVGSAEEIDFSNQ